MIKRPDLPWAARDERSLTAAAWWPTSSGMTDTLGPTSSAERLHDRRRAIGAVVAGPIVPDTPCRSEHSTTDASPARSTKSPQADRPPSVPRTGASAGGYGCRRRPTVVLYLGSR